MALWMSQFLDTTGDGSGSTDGAVDGSITPVTLKITGEAGYTADLERMIVQIRDNTTLAAEKYGGITALTTGIKVTATTGGRKLDLLSGLTVKSVADWGRYCYDVHQTDFGSGDNFVEVRWTFGKAGEPIQLMGSDESLNVVISDDLSALVGHTFCVQGTVERSSTSTSKVTRFHGPTV